MPDHVTRRRLATFSLAFHGRAQQAGAPTKATAEANAKPNADPSPLKGIRDDSESSFPQPAKLVLEK
jgi:hypothetical protein